MKRKFNRINTITDNKVIFEICSITHGLFLVSVDKEDWEKVNLYNWSISKSTNGYFRAETRNEKRKLVRLHRYILNLKNGNPTEIDHKDGNPLNNKKEN